MLTEVVFVLTEPERQLGAPQEAEAWRAGCANFTLQAVMKNYYAPNPKAALTHQKCYPKSAVFPAKIPSDGLCDGWTTGDVWPHQGRKLVISENPCLKSSPVSFKS